MILGLKFEELTKIGCINDCYCNGRSSIHALFCMGSPFASKDVLYPIALFLFILEFFLTEE